MRRAVATALALTVGTPAIAQGDPASRPAVACGLPYEIRPGDTLHRIAVRAYGPQGNYRTLFAANAPRLRWPDASSIETGQVIAVPCPDGAAPEAPAVAALPESPSAGAAARAVAVAALGSGARLDARPEPPDGLARLLGPDLYRLALPLARPDCAAAADPATRRLCDAYLWSAPLAARVDTLVGRAGDPAPAALDASRLCRASETGAGPDAAACLDAVLAGRADYALLDAGRLDALAAEPERAGRLREHPGFAREVTLHAVAARDAPGSAADIARLDAALAALEESGRAHALRIDALILADQAP